MASETVFETWYEVHTADGGMESYMTYEEATIRIRALNAGGTDCQYFKKQMRPTVVASVWHPARSYAKGN